MKGSKGCAPILFAGSEVLVECSPPVELGQEGHSDQDVASLASVERLGDKDMHTAHQICWTNKNRMENVPSEE